VEEKMGLHGQSTCELNFGMKEDCVGYLCGKENEGIQNMFHMMNEARLLCGVQGEGQANLCYELTLQYAKERSQFGKEIIQHPDVRRMLLKMRSMARSLRSITLYSAHLFDLNQADEIGLLTPICKSFGSEEGFNLTIDAIQVHGGYGYCTEYGIEQFARDAKIATIYEGTNGIQAIDFLQRKILKDQAKTFFLVGSKIAQTLKTDHARHFNEERGLIIENQKQVEEILKRFKHQLGENKIDSVFQHASDFMHYCGNLLASWRLLESACIAEKLLHEGKGKYDEAYLESKKDDFRIFCQHYLSRNSAISKRLLDFRHNVMSMEL
jgi:hypothetical protein